MSNLANLQPFAQPGTPGFPAPRSLALETDGGTLNYESFYLGGTLLPGQWLLTAATRVFGLQVQKGYGLTGGTLRVIGDDPMTFTFTVKIWTPADADAYADCLKTCLRKPVNIVPGTPDSAAYGIDQPQVVAMGVDTVVVKSVTALLNPLVTSGGKGAWTATVEFLEWRKPIPAVASPSQRIPDKAAPAPTAHTAVQIENQKLLAVQAAKAKEILQKTGWGPKP